MQPCSDVSRRLLLLVVTAGLALGIALVLRYGLIEAEGWATRCAQEANVRCLSRHWVIALFEHNRLGYLSLAAALLALLAPLRGLAWLAWSVGLMGLVLYCPDSAAPATLLALLILARTGAPSKRQSPAQA